MALTLKTIPCLNDNYAFLLHDAATGATALIDAPEPAPILAALATEGWQLTDILLTHHHDDHIAATQALVAATGAKVWGAAKDASRLPPLDHALQEGDHITICGETVQILDVSGHTINHIAFHFPASAMAFTGDSLMAMGCGRLFEGTPAQMWHSLQKLMALPPQTLICSGHEYTASNARFAASLDLHNPALTSRITDITAARAANRPTVPSTLAMELATNPFLRAPQLKPALGLHDTSDAETFAHIRALKDNFR